MCAAARRTGEREFSRTPFGFLLKKTYVGNGVQNTGLQAKIRPAHDFKEEGMPYLLETPEKKFLYFNHGIIAVGQGIQLEIVNVQGMWGAHCDWCRTGVPNFGGEPINIVGPEICPNCGYNMFKGHECGQKGQ